MVGKWFFTFMDVSENSGTPKSSILIGCSLIDHPFWGTPIFGNTHMVLWLFWGQNSTSISATTLPLALNPCLVWKSRPAVRRSPSQSCGTRPSARPGERTLPGDMATWPLWNVRKLIGIDWYDPMYLYQPTWLASNIKQAYVQRRPNQSVTTWPIERLMALRAV